MALRYQYAHCTAAWLPCRGGTPRAHIWQVSLRAAGHNIRRLGGGQHKQQRRGAWNPQAGDIVHALALAVSRFTATPDVLMMEIADSRYRARTEIQISWENVKLIQESSIPLAARSH